MGSNTQARYPRRTEGDKMTDYVIQKYVVIYVFLGNTSVLQLYALHHEDHSPISPPLLPHFYISPHVHVPLQFP